eukprot:NODE_254_length_2576_cov_17.180482_g237_i0.p1 GENE.NODE_254_length_2576_cov_17.180482_g237_i0~~NODE_254_length_2576_cov_17.180482_g237_i0.p1  ORF type:complete len:843 (-),score=258.77 NODE_254_length_2576_cov_17.180482_g237_i0:48-2378(-)
MKDVVASVQVGQKLMRVVKSRTDEKNSLLEELATKEAEVVELAEQLRNCRQELASSKQNAVYLETLVMQLSKPERSLTRVDSTHSSSNAPSLSLETTFVRESRELMESMEAHSELLGKVQDLERLLEVAEQTMVTERLRADALQEAVELGEEAEAQSRELVTLELHGLQEENETLKDQLDRKQSELNTVLTELQSAVDDNALLMQKCREALAKAERMQFEAKAQQTNNDQFAQRLLEAEASCQSAEEAWEEKLRQSQTKLESLTLDFETLQHQLAASYTQCHELSTSVDALKSKCTALEAERGSDEILRPRLVEYEAKLFVMQRTRDEWQRQAKHTEVLLMEAEGRLNIVLTTDHLLVASTLKTNEDSRSALSTQFAQLTAEYTDARAHFEAELLRTREECVDERRKQQARASEVVSLQAQLQANQVTLSESETERRTTTVECQRLQTELKQRDARNASVRADLERLHARLDEWKERARSLEGELATERAHSQQLLSTNAKYETREAAHLSELSHLRGTHAAELGELRAALKTAEQALRTERERVDVDRKTQSQERVCLLDQLQAKDAELQAAVKVRAQDTNKQTEAMELMLRRFQEMQDAEAALQRQRQQSLAQQNEKSEHLHQQLTEWLSDQRALASQQQQYELEWLQNTMEIAKLDRQAHARRHAELEHRLHSHLLHLLSTTHDACHLVTAQLERLLPHTHAYEEQIALLQQELIDRWATHGTAGRAASPRQRKEPFAVPPERFNSTVSSQNSELMAAAACLVHFNWENSIVA